MDRWIDRKENITRKQKKKIGQECCTNGRREELGRGKKRKGGYKEE